MKFGMRVVFWFFSFISLVVAIENGSGSSSGMTMPGEGDHIQALRHKSMKRRSSARALEETSYEVGTNVADYFAKEGVWYTGTILKVDDDIYTIQWSNGKTEDFDIDDVDEIIENYDSKAYDSDAPDEHEYSYEVGTNVADYFADDGGWCTGSILLTTGGAYTIQWSDGSTTRYHEDEIDEIVDNYQSGVYVGTAQYSSGTRVADFFEDEEKWYSGSIVGYHDGVYTVVWEDGTTSKYDADEIDEIVSNAKGLSLSLGAKIGIVFLVLAFTCCVYNRLLQRRRHQHSKETEENACIVEVAAYTDEPSGEQGTFSDTSKIV